MAIRLGTPGNDSIVGTAENDEITGDAGRDKLQGGLGDDTLDGGAGADELLGGEGADKLFDTVGEANLLDGGAGDDVLTLTIASFAGLGDPAAITNLQGGSGDDWLVLRLDPAALDAPAVAGLIALRAQISSGGLVAPLGLSLSGIEHLSLVDLAGAPITRLAPVASSGQAQTDEDRSLSGQLPKALDFDGDALRYAVASRPGHGSVKIASNGSYVYVPEADFSGTDSFSFKVFDGVDWSADATLSVVVQPVNDAPRLVHALPDQSFETGTEFTFSLSADAFVDVDSTGLTDAPGLSYALTLSGGAALPGWLHFDPMTLVLTGNADVAQAGVLRIEVSASDGLSSSRSEFLLGVAGALNQAPVTVTSQIQINEDQTLVTQLPLATDADGDALTFAWYSSPHHGTLNLRSDGSFNYWPDVNFSGTDSFEYRVRDGRGGEAVATMEITIAAVNDVPSAGAKILGTAQVGEVLYLDLDELTDADGLPTEFDVTWLRNGVADSRDHNAGFALSGDDFGATIEVRVRYVDGAGSTENLSVLVGTPVTGFNTVIGTDAGEQLLGSVAPDRISALDGNDRLTGGAGNDLLDGGNGVDCAVFNVDREQATLSFNGLYFAINSLAEGNDRLISIERVEFSNGYLALDIAGHAGQAARTIGALFGAAALKDKALVGAELHLLDEGMGYSELVAAALKTPLFKQLAGAAQGVVSNSQFVSLVYKNLVGVLPGADDLSLYVGLLDNGTFTQETLAYAASEHALNAANIDLVGLATTGIAFTPPPLG